ncbi:MAG: T9SS C-terminal target domain-containing protein, partial [Bacteroidetes bacterium]
NSPAAGADQVFPNPILSWTSNGTNSSGIIYEVQLATTSSFSSLLETALTESTIYQSRQANSGFTTYFWRVRALSPCGNSAYSAIASFTTNNITCRRYTNNNRLDISEIGTPTISRNINIEESHPVADLAVEIDLEHPYQGDLSARLVSPAGSSITLFDRPGHPIRDFGCMQAGLVARWTDRASQSAATLDSNCEQRSEQAITPDNTYRPQQSFSGLRNQDSRGNWLLELTDHSAGDGGQLRSWSLEVCYAIVSALPRLVVNETLPVARGNEATLSPAYLRADHAGSNDSSLVYRITDLPNEGQIYRDNQLLGINDVFTQSDINAGRVRYLHGGGIVLDDSFGFSLTGANGQSQLGNVFRIRVQLAELTTYLEQITSIRCAGESTASLRVIVSGGLPPYDYALNGGAFQDLHIFENLAAGDYQVTVLDAQGDTASSAVLTVSSPEPLRASVDTTARTLEVMASGGRPPYNYRINNGIYQPSPIFPNLPNGDYLIEVRDTNDCLFGTTATIAVNDLRISTAIVRPISCAGANDGIIIAGVDGGQAPYLYALNGGPFQTENIFSNLSPGNYPVRVRDQQGFTRTSNTVTLDEPQVLRASASTNEYTVAVAASGGTPPYLYNLSPSTIFQHDPTFTVSANGIYTLTVRDSRNCLTSTQATVAVNTLMLSTQLVAAPSCAQSNDGIIEANVSGGSPPYRYRLNNGPYQSGRRFSNLTAGTYTLSVIDGDGFTRTAAPYDLEAPLPLLLSAEVIDNTIVARAQGGTPPYRYRLGLQGTPQDSPRFDSLPNGDYTLLVTDNNGCLQSVSVRIRINTLVVSGEILRGISCAGAADAALRIHASGGRAPYQYQINQDDFQDTPQFDGLGPGSYLLSVRDADGFVRTIDSPIQISEPAALAVVAAVAENNVEVSVSGGTPPYLYSLDDIHYQPGSTFRDLPDAIYRIYVQDSRACRDSAHALVAFQPIDFELRLLDSIRCAADSSGRIAIQVRSSFRPYIYQLNEGQLQADSVYSALPAGDYQVRVRDAIGREKTKNYRIPAPDPLSLAVNIDGHIVTALANGGTPPYSYQLGDSAWQDSRQFTEVPNGEYTLRVQDALACEQEILISILVPTTHALTERWSLVAYPNPTTGTLQIQLPQPIIGEAATFEVFDIYSRSIQRQSFSALPEQLRLNLGQLPAGMYLLRLEAAERWGQIRVMVE